MAGGYPLPYPVTDLLRAVQAEITAVLSDDMNAAEKVSLHDGRQIGSSGHARDYVFSCKRWNEAFAGSKILIRPSGFRGPWERAEAMRMPDGKVRVSTKANLGDSPRSAQLVEDDTAGWEMLAERLEQTGDTNGPVNLTTAGWIVGSGSPHISRCPDPNRFIRDYQEREFNAAQRRAIEQALGSDVTFIWGPPGTGKTEVVGTIVEGCYRQGLHVVFAAPTNVAVDQALERICELLSVEDGFEDGLVQRVGEIAIASLSAKYGDNVNADRIAERLSSGLDERIREITTELEKVRGHLAIHQDADRISTEVHELETDDWTLQRKIGAASVRIDDARRMLSSLKRAIEQIGTPSGIFARRKQEKRDELHSAMIRYENEWAKQRKEHSIAVVEQERCRDRRVSARRKLAMLRPLLDGIPPLRACDDQAKWLKESLTVLQDERQKIAESVRGRCRVTATTVSKAVQARAVMESVDVVVIDEAGMVNLPSAWCTAGLAAKRVVVAGDFRQLPAVTRGSQNRKVAPISRDHSLAWMDRDPFDAAGLVNETGRARVGDARLAVLTEQFRMRPAICALVNAVAYPDSPLTTGRNDRSSLPKSPLIESPLVLIDTSNRDLKATNRASYKSNTMHEAVIHELIRGLQYDTVLPARKWTDIPEGRRAIDCLAVITPYNDQKKALNVSLKYRFGVEYEGLVDTVHRFQGSQRPLVIVDTVAGSGQKLGYFYESNGLSSRTCRLLNVALSRAQDHLIVVANVDFMRARLTPGSEAMQMLQHLIAHAQPLGVDDLIPMRSAADLAGLDADELARPAFFPADEVPRAVQWDIDHSEHSIDIYCAFLDPRPVRSWLRHIAQQIQRGITVRVHTRLPQPGTANLVGELETAGCQVSLRERMHEKVVIIDDAVLWHGSLNLFANTGCTDLMMRITDPGSCQRVRHILDRARMDRPARRHPWVSPAGATSLPDDVYPGRILDGRRYLNVPFAEKEDLKRLGPRWTPKWDPKRRLWHVDANAPTEDLDRWLPPESGARPHGG